MPHIFAAYSFDWGILSMPHISVANTSMPQIFVAFTCMTRVSSFSAKITVSQCHIMHCCAETIQILRHDNRRGRTRALVCPESIIVSQWLFTACTRIRFDVCLCSVCGFFRHIMRTGNVHWFWLKHKSSFNRKLGPLSDILQAGA